MTDDETILRAKQGEALAWRELYRAHAGRLVAWLRTRPTGDASLSPEDLASEAWLVAAERIPEFEGSSSDFAGWLFGISRNIASNATRRSQRRRTDPTTVDDTLVGAAEQNSPEGDVWVREMIMSLPPRERDVVGCIEGLGLDISSTAAALGISPVAVRVARHRGLRRLRGVLESPPPPLRDASSVSQPR